MFPSFVSLLASDYSERTIALLLFDGTLTAAAFEAESNIPDFLYSIPLDPEEGEESIEDARGKLLSLFDLGSYQVAKDILVAHDVLRTSDGFFKFEHEWLVGESSDLSLDQDVLISADELWTSDLRQREFKEVEQTRRNQARARWKGIVGWSWSCGMAAILLHLLSLRLWLSN